MSYLVDKLILDDIFDVDDEIRMDKEELILDENYFRLAIKPVDPRFQVVWDMYKQQQAAFWTAEEIDFNEDSHDFEKLNENVQHFIKMVLAFFAGADTIVNININKNFQQITIREINVCYGWQMAMENIHGETYADMLTNIVKDKEEQNKLINAFKTVDSIKKMIEFGNKWIDSDRRIAYKIFAFCIFEGLFFSGAFASIYWLKKVIGQAKMKGLIQSNNLIAKDEGMHVNFGCLLYTYIKYRIDDDEAIQLMKDAVDIAKGFTDDALPIALIGMNNRLMGEYIEYVADRLMVNLKYKKIYNTNLPEAFKFMESIGFLNKDNFFERRPTEYMRANNSNNTAGMWEFKILDEY